MEKLASQAHWTLRVALASVFLFHGLPKVIGFAQFAESNGIPVFAGLLVAIAEVGGALLVLAGGFVGGGAGGLMTRLGALAFIPVMIGAIAIAHWPRWSFEPSESFPIGGMEFQVTLILISLYLLVKGDRVKSGASPST